MMSMALSTPFAHSDNREWDEFAFRPFGERRSLFARRSSGKLATATAPKLLGRAISEGIETFTGSRRPRSLSQKTEQQDESA
jgi:hypothetical protein